MEEGISDINEDKNEKYDEDKEAECLYYNYSIEVEEGISDRNDDKNGEMDEVKEAEFLDYTYPDEIEEGVSDFKMTGVKKMTRE